jgi:tRNA-dihydrouridine synthase A
VVAAGVDAIWVHARKAWLSGLSPQENREVPPLDYGKVAALKRAHPGTFIGINGGITTLDQAEAMLADVDGVMLGRAACHNPSILLGVDRRFYGDRDRPRDAAGVVHAMRPYIAAEVATGTRLATIVHSMLGLFQGVPGARRWRQILTVDAIRPGAGAEVVEAALAAVTEPTRPRLTLQPTDREPAFALA